MAQGLPVQPTKLWSYFEGEAEGVAAGAVVAAGAADSDAVGAAVSPPPPQATRLVLKTAPRKSIDVPRRID
jgi:hypothetical protein